MACTVLRIDAHGRYPRLTCRNPCGPSWLRADPDRDSADRSSSRSSAVVGCSASRCSGGRSSPCSRPSPRTCRSAKNTMRCMMTLASPLRFSLKRVATRGICGLVFVLTGTLSHAADNLHQHQLTSLHTPLGQQCHQNLLRQ